MKLKVFISSHQSKRTRYALSDSPVTTDAVEASIDPQDLATYLAIKQEYERWQDRIKQAKRYRGIWI
jgi:hypothetical protein